MQYKAVYYSTSLKTWGKSHTTTGSKAEVTTAVLRYLETIEDNQKDMVDRLTFNSYMIVRLDGVDATVDTLNRLEIKPDAV